MGGVLINNRKIWDIKNKKIIEKFFKILLLYKITFEKNFILIVNYYLLKDKKEILKIDLGI
ncbi:MAG: hypothetical protein ACEY3I_01225 [Arsenophonus sp.]